MKFFVINRVQTLLGILMDMISSVILEYVSMDAWTGMMIFVNAMYTHLYYFFPQNTVVKSNTNKP